MVFKWPVLPALILVWYLPYNVPSDTTAQHNTAQRPHMHVHMHMSACVHVCVVFLLSRGSTHTVSGKRKSLDRCRVTVDPHHCRPRCPQRTTLHFTSLLCDTDKRKTHAHDTVHMLSSLSVSPPGTHPLPRGVRGGVFFCLLSTQRCSMRSWSQALVSGPCFSRCPTPPRGTTQNKESGGTRPWRHPGWGHRA